jgi:hypothetical protein
MYISSSTKRIQIKIPYIIIFEFSSIPKIIKKQSQNKSKFQRNKNQKPKKKKPTNKTKEII